MVIKKSSKCQFWHDMIASIIVIGFLVAKPIDKAMYLLFGTDQAFHHTQDNWHRVHIFSVKSLFGANQSVAPSRHDF